MYSCIFYNVRFCTRVNGNKTYIIYYWIYFYLHHKCDTRNSEGQPKQSTYISFERKSPLQGSSGTNLAEFPLSPTAR
jgi:hypothetical protein